MAEPRLGFLGIGLMGRPMALNLARAGTALTIWNRTPGKADELRVAGAAVAETPDDVFAASDVVFEMLATESAIDEVLGRHESGFRVPIAGRTLVHMGTTAPEYSATLEAAVRQAGGRYVEAPVSGSRGPAQRGELVIMLAGDRDAVAQVERLVAPLARQTTRCGAVPNALLMKLAVNLYLITMVTGLAESVHLAKASGLDLDLLARVLDAGPMASNVSTAKLAKLLGADYSAQAGAHDVFKNARLVAAAARAAGVASPVLDVCRDLFAETVALGHSDEDMVAVIRAIAARRTGQATASSRSGPSSRTTVASGRVEP
ncbi:MAG: NAD(P)-dependent oxidoreductase [Actinomycetales bacterium]